MIGFLISLITCFAAFGQSIVAPPQTNGFLIWKTLPVATNYSVSVYKTVNLGNPWSLYTTVNNPNTNSIPIAFSGASGFFYGKYAATNFVTATNFAVVTNAFTVTNTVVVTNPAPNTVTLGWDASSSSDVSGYNVYAGSNSHSYIRIIPAGYSFLANVSNIYNTNFFAATAYNTNGIESGYSSEISYIRPPTRFVTNVFFTTNYVIFTNTTFSTNISVGITNLDLILAAIRPIGNIANGTNDEVGLKAIRGNR